MSGVAAEARTHDSNMEPIMDGMEGDMMGMSSHCSRTMNQTMSGMQSEMRRSRTLRLRDDAVMS
jgi:hypothetical protein